eukprot:COSAG06_NODE_2527_length_6720_cov_2.669687_6_plen_201_part_00
MTTSTVPSRNTGGPYSSSTASGALWASDRGAIYGRQTGRAGGWVPRTALRRLAVVQRLGIVVLVVPACGRLLLGCLVPRCHARADLVPKAQAVLPRQHIDDARHAPAAAEIAVLANHTGVVVAPAPGPRLWPRRRRRFEDAEAGQTAGVNQCCCRRRPAPTVRSAFEPCSCRESRCAVQLAANLNSLMPPAPSTGIEIAY